MNIGIYIYEDAEVLDFAGPFEVFATAARLQPEASFAVYLIGETGAEVTARGGFRVVPHFGFDNHPRLDVLLVVGGVHHSEMRKPQVLSWIAKQAESVSALASVCTGIFLLAAAGVATVEAVTTHWQDIEDLRDQFPHLQVEENRRWIDTGKLISSAGISAGIDMSLHLVSRLKSEKLADATARQMEFSRCC